MLWKCTICGMLHEGDAPPEKCPKCGMPAENFKALTDEEAKKVTTAERTNDIHMEIIKLAAKIEALAAEGIEINLDPPCVSLFKQAKDEAWIIKHRGIAEIAGHVARGKW